MRGHWHWCQKQQYSENTLGVLYFFPGPLLLQGGWPLDLPDELGAKVFLLQEKVEYVLFQSINRNHYHEIYRPKDYRFRMAVGVQIFESNWVQAVNRCSLLDSAGSHLLREMQRLGRGAWAQCQVWVMTKRGCWKGQTSLCSEMRHVLTSKWSVFTCSVVSGPKLTKYLCHHFPNCIPPNTHVWKNTGELFYGKRRVMFFRFA